MTSRTAGLLERRVPQYLVMYVGLGWGLVQFVSFFERFGISPGWANMTLITLLLFLPSVLLISYNHGRPGKDRWTALEKAVLPLNLTVAVMVGGAGRDLGAVVTTVTVTDENGTVMERPVANAAYRRRAALFSFDGELPDSLVWLRDGAAAALGADLSQDIFLDLRPQALFREKLREAGYADGTGVPLTLKRQIAEELHLAFFITGVVETGPEGHTVRVTVYETATGEPVRERVSTGRDILAVADELSKQVRQDMKLPSARPAGVMDLPVGEMMSTKPGAFRALIEGSTAAARDEWAKAEQFFVRATQLDSTFALAHYALYQSRMVSGNAQGSIAPLEAAMRHIKRMPERVGFLVKADHYFMKQDMDKAMAMFTMMSELYPDDLSGHMGKAQLHQLRNEPDSAIAALRRVLELDPQQHEQKLKIGELQEAMGAHEAALETYEKYAAEFAKDPAAYVNVARVQQRLGRADDARTTLEKALILAPTNVTAMIDLAAVDRSTGEFDASWERLQEALSHARTAEDRNRVWEAIRTWHSFRGQNRLALEAAANELAAFAEFQPPLQVVISRMGLFNLYAQAGRLAQARTELVQVKAQLQAPLDQFWRIGQFELAVETRDTTQLIEAIAGCKQLIAAFRFDFFTGKVMAGEALVAEMRGDWAAALELYEKSYELDPRQLAAGRDIARAYRHLGKLDEAEAALAEHLRAVPASAESNLELARIRLLKGDKTGARDAVERTLRTLEPADAGHQVLTEAKALLAEIG